MRQFVTKLLLFALVAAVPTPLIASIFFSKGDRDPKTRLQLFYGQLLEDDESKHKLKDDPKFKDDPKHKLKDDPKFKDDPKHKLKDDPKFKPKEEPKPKVVPVGPLGEDLAELLRHHPEIRLAEAKLALAEIELQRVRADIIRQALALKFKVEQARLVFQRAAQLGPVGDMSELNKALLLYEQAQEEYRAFIQPVPRGPARPINPGPPVPPGPPPQPIDLPNETLPLPPGQEVSEQMFERVQNFLAAKMTFNGGEIVVADLLKGINQELPAESRLVLSVLREIGDTVVELPAGHYTGRGLLQLITDQQPDVRVLVRQYGLLVTWKDRAPDKAMSWDMVPPRAKE